LRVSTTGGGATPLNGSQRPTRRLDAGVSDVPARWPPRAVLDTGSGGVGEAAIYGAALDSADRTLVLKGAESNAMYANGYLFFLRNSTLMAQPFFVGRLAVSGDAVPVAEQVQQTGGGVRRAGRFGVRSDGRVPNRPWRARIPHAAELVRSDRQGRRHHRRAGRLRRHRDLA
jgi:hypothetical protein